MQEPQITAGQISIGSAFQFALDCSLKHFPLLLAVQVTMGLPQIVLATLVPGIWGTLLAIILQSPLWGGYLTILVALADGQNPSYGDLFKKVGMFWKFLLLTICTFTITVVGCVLLIVPGIIAGIHLAFSNVCVATEGLGPIEAMKRSSALTKGYRWQLLGIFSVQCVALALIGGLFIGIPLGIVAGIFHLDSKQLIHLVMPVLMVPLLILIGLVLVYCYRQLTIVQGGEVTTV